MNVHSWQLCMYSQGSYKCQNRVYIKSLKFLPDNTAAHNWLLLHKQTVICMGLKGLQFLFQWKQRHCLKMLVIIWRGYVQMKITSILHLKWPYEPRQFPKMFIAVSLTLIFFKIKIACHSYTTAQCNSYFSMEGKS